ncbi:TIGR03905 family TSCPD domain-containing protein [Caproicibacter sp.]|uniref:TIGR03905 family TSCPD domain-containing protein n=1 Tax=Caproicibacter sp. TaxID=2814884 RepID=UPI003989102D
MQYRYKTRGTCSTEMMIDLDGDTIRSVKITGGCSGNLQGICALVQGQKAEDVIRLLQGIRCGLKPTSCPDQLAKALTLAREKSPET